FKICNHGMSKAIITSTEFAASIDEAPGLNPVFDVLRQERCPTTFEHGVELNWQVTIIPKQLGETDFQEVAQGKQFVRFKGCIRYLDVFDEERVTKFYLRWKPHLQLMDYGEWEEIGQPEDNRNS
ncbi:MAG: hypothetical protein WBD66_08215, partial [Candidatus Acidiferrales bacterium]